MLIKYIGLKKLTEQEINNIKQLVLLYANKYDIKIASSTLIFDIKKHDIEGKKAKYSIHVRVDNPHIMFNVKRSGWDLRRTLHQLFKALNHQITHRLKGIERGYTKPYEKNPR